MGRPNNYCKSATSQEAEPIEKGAAAIAVLLKKPRRLCRAMRTRGRTAPRALERRTKTVTPQEPQGERPCEEG